MVVIGEAAPGCRVEAESDAAQRPAEEKGPRRYRGRIQIAYSRKPLPAPGADELPPILVIDDDPVVLESLTLALESHGFRVLTARNGYQGLRVFREGSPAIVVTDIMMPEQDGIGAMLQMRRERPSIKIVAISGAGCFDGWDCLRAAEHLGADATFPKAIDTDALLETLRSLLDL